MTSWIVVLGAGAGSFAFRISIVALIDRISAPAALERLSAFVVPAAFAGIAASALARPLADGGIGGFSLAVALVVTAAASARGRSVPIAFAGGLVTLWATTALTAVLPIAA